MKHHRRARGEPAAALLDWGVVVGSWVIVGLALALGLLSLRGGAGGRRYARARLTAPPPVHTPPATVIVPVKGQDEGLAENLAALARLNYPDYELIVVARASADIAAGVVPATAKVVLAEEAIAGTGEKVTNLIAAVRAARPESEVLAFADSDGQVEAGWLRALVAGLAEPQAGAATGYRHYLPEPPDFWSLLRGVWNGVIAGQFGEGPAPFAWGGSMAIRRDTFERAAVMDHWRNSVSDDYGLSTAVQRADLRIVYAPGASVVSTDHTGAAEFLRWIQRQLIITRVYRPGLWWTSLVGHLVYCGAMTISAGWTLQGNLTGAYTLIAQLVFGMIGGAQRLAAMRASLPKHQNWFRRHGRVHIWWVPLGTWVWLYGLLASAVTNSFEWRGNRYRLTARVVEKL